MITALKAKKMCNSTEDYIIFQEFVFHNSSLAYLTSESENRTDFIESYIQYWKIGISTPKVGNIQ